MALQRAVRSSMKFGTVAVREKKISSHVPYVRHVDETTLRTKEGMILSILKIDGFCHQTADQSEIDMKANVRNTLMRSLGDSRYAVYSHIIRRRITPQTAGSFSNPFCRDLNDRYMQGLAEKRMYANDLYLTVIRRGFQGKVGLADAFVSRFRNAAGVSAEVLDREARLELKEQVANIQKDMAEYGARILTATVRNGSVYSEPLEFLAQLLNGAQQIPMLLPRMGLDEYLPTRRITFGKKQFELRGGVDSETRFGSMVSSREYPSWTVSGVLDGLLKIPGEFIATQSFALQDRAPVMEEIAKVERQIAASDEAGTSLEEAINIARDEIVNGRAVMGHHHLTVMAIGDSLRELEACVQAVTKEIQNTGMVTVREDLNAEPAFWAQLPGNFAYIARRAMISSRNFCGLASFHNFAVGKPSGNHWGPAISLLQTTSMTPYYFNFHRLKVGNFTVVGPTNSGKTTGLAFLMAQAMRVTPQPRCVFFDTLRGADIFIRALGGQYEVLEPGVATGFNPLQLEGSASDRAFVLDLLRFLVRPRDGRQDLSPEQENILEAAVQRIFAIPVSERNFAEVSHLLRGGEKAGHDDLASRFNNWCDARGWLFNNPADQWDAEKGIVGFDLTKVLDDPDIRTAALGYIFHRIEGMLDGKTPMMLFIDEGWKVLSDDKFSKFLNEKLKTIRRLHGIVGFGTQSAKDIVSSKMGHTILEQTTTNLFFPNAKADRESYIDGFKLSEVEFNWVLTTPPETRQFLIKHANDSVIATLDLSHMLDFVKVISGNEATVAECEDLRQRYGDHAEKWLPYFCGWRTEA
ncbi:type VI secretion protein [Phyllobacterium brassicacearum]|uniref:Type VI secretion protein n=1 Tax=Phyllobacterium brassicacearum TaxID=314235 RepID=A0A2P7BA39_9HYPH|nr:VirB4 family type IV secretion/conjugal transfer ATPase [Phyllobacterium brassicacearum]PSH63330.1 type VI secretion protein [Phyllobacterium brassicacearum]TDQ18178.1 type IV secretion system protein VirB4 [Phyllobacterium brassicacearum]